MAGGYLFFFHLDGENSAWDMRCLAGLGMWPVCFWWTLQHYMAKRVVWGYQGVSSYKPTIYQQPSKQQNRAAASY